MNSNRKTLRMLLSFVVLFIGSLYISVAFLGEDWSGQRKYLLSVASLLLTIVVSAALLVGVFKLVALLWNKMIDRSISNDSGQNDPDSHQDSHQDKE
ncbi:MAG: hypothetical protein V4603_08785 [Pseudomonadota bacterium]